MKHRPLRRAALSVLLVLCCALLSGCFEALHVDDQSYPVAIGFDRGTARRFRVSLQIPELSGSDSDQKSGIALITAEGDDLHSVKSIVDSSVPWVVNFSHVGYLIVSDELAKSADMEELLTELPRFLKLRQSNVLIVAKRSAELFLEGLRTSANTNPGRILSDLMLEPALSGKFPRSLLEEYHEALFSDCYDTAIALGSYNSSVTVEDEEQGGEGETGGQSEQGGTQQRESEGQAGEQPGKTEGQESEPPSPAPQPDDPEDTPAGSSIRKNGLQSELSGCALFRDGQMVGELTGRQTQLLQLGRGSFHRGDITLRNLENAQPLSLRLVQKSAPDVRFEALLSSAPRAIVTLHLDATPYEAVTPGDQALTLYQPADDALIAKKTVAQLTEGLEELEALFRSLKSDLWGLGRFAVRNFSRAADWEAFGWRERFAALDISWRIELSVSEPQIEFMERPSY